METRTSMEHGAEGYESPALNSIRLSFESILCASPDNGTAGDLDEIIWEL